MKLSEQEFYYCPAIDRNNVERIVMVQVTSINFAKDKCNILAVDYNDMEAVRRFFSSKGMQWMPYRISMIVHYFKSTKPTYKFLYG